VGQGDIVGRSGYFSLNLSANSVMRGRLDARRTLKSLVADLRNMRTEILQLKDLGRMPNESINDTESIDELVNTYDALLEQIQLPISFDEAMVLVQIFPENAFYDLQWSLLKLVESVCVDDENKYIQLINSCPSQEWRDTLNARYANYKRHKG
jgi:hypothetical protein